MAAGDDRVRRRAVNPGSEYVNPAQLPLLLASGQRTSLTSTALGEEAVWSVEGLAYASVQASAVVGATWPVALVLEVAFSIDGIVWHALPSSPPADFSGAAIRVGVDVRSVRFVRVSVKTVSSSAHGPVDVCVYGESGR